MWWEAHPIPAKRVFSEQYGATTPLSLNGAIPDYSYPSGHATRWSFIGLIACWLFLRQVRRHILRGLLMALAFAIAFGGGLMQFYIGVHLVTDLVGGYLLGISSVCCAIGLLLLNETRNRNDSCDLIHLSTSRNDDTLLRETGTVLSEPGVD
jgi:membrane-associated phospholipid phosphatase